MGTGADSQAIDRRFPDDHGHPDYSRLFRLDGLRALVVGAGSGIGREAAYALGAHGAEVVCADANLAAAEETARVVGEAYEIDLLDSGQVAAAAQDIGRVDVLFFTPATNVRKRLLDYTRDEYDRVIALNLGGAFELIRAFGAPMVAHGSGSIIGCSSIRSQVVEPGQASTRPPRQDSSS